MIIIIDKKRSIEDYVNGAIQRLKEYIEKSKERLITPASNRNDKRSTKIKKSRK